MDKMILEKMNKRSASQTKRAIMDAALNLFTRYGFSRTTMRMIAKEANMSVGALYVHFRNKEDLGLFILREKMEELLEEINRSIAREKKAESKLKAFIETCLSHARKNRELIVAHSKEKGFTFGLEVKKEYYERHRDLVKQIVSQGIREGEFREINPEDVARVVTALIRGYVISMILEEEHTPTEPDYWSLLFYGLKKG